MIFGNYIFYPNEFQRIVLFDYVMFEPVCCFSGFASVLASVSAFESLQAVSSCPWVSISVVRVLVSFWVVQDQNPNRKAFLL